jgi:hypothetical protein
MSLPKNNIFSQVGQALDPTMNGIAGKNYWAVKAAQAKSTAIAPPSPPPDLSDAVKRSADENQALQLLASGRGRKSTFLTGPGGDASMPVLFSPKLGGG